MNWNRRRVTQAMTLAALSGGLAPWAWRSQVAAAEGLADGGLGGVATDYELTIAETPFNVTGRTATANLVNQVLPAPVLHWREGDIVTIRVRNLLPEPTSIHWHGLLVTPAMDGVPGLGFPGIAPGETFTYRFPLRQHGTYWYHSHSAFQEQAGFYGAIVIEPRDADPVAVERDYVVVLSDWTDEDPHRVQAKLKKQSDYYNFRQRTVGDFFRDVERDGFRATWQDRSAWRGMRMNPTDLADISGYTYTYLVNGRTADANWTALYQPGERIRLRFINAAAMTFFDVRIPGLPMTVVAADGQPVEPVTVDEFRIGNAETYDVIVAPPANAAYTIFAQSMDRSGFARGTLAPAMGMSAAVPPVDSRPVLTMAEMGHGTGHAGHDPNAHAGHDMSSHQVSDAGAAGPPVEITHESTEFGPGVDMRVTTPTTRLDDPGIGLRDNGRRVLTYADLQSAFPDPDGREPGRTLELHLTGHMARYQWSFNGLKFSEAEPIRLRYGERLRVVLVNDTMMEHPIHLHGMWSDLEDEEGRFKLRKHTLSVQPAQRLTFRVRADALGRWPLHCHLLFHMENGMFREVIVDETGV